MPGHKSPVLTQHLGLKHIFLLERLLESIQDRHSPFCFLIVGIASAFSAFCYAELASRWPSAGSAYHYSYICVGEGLCILPFFLAHQEIPGLDIIVDPCAAIIVLFVTGLLCVGIKESSLAISGENLVDVGTLK
ncbi:hypothetical protein KPL71_023602 [Citrus sinensis]|uniref:Uncharacterized protein n=1 Tax=Citrus sinensis TaxID=2711 RepID=A0ACB8IM25_CITSI|nr:hypothetical protein KPL71_023602 [Citrus sinensis]